MPRKPTKTSLRRKLDKAWREYIYKRDKHKCQMCEGRRQKEVINAHHIITKGSSGLAGRWDVDNGITLCYLCHQTDYIALRDFCYEWLKKKGIDLYELRDKYKANIYKPTQDDLQTKLKILETLND